MKQIKRYLAVVLALMLCLSAAAIPAWAEPSAPSGEGTGSIVVYAYDTSGAPIPNASFIVYSVASGLEAATGLTDGSGTATIGNLPVGAYIVTETVIPEPYVLNNPTVSNIAVAKDRSSYVRFTHIPKSTIQIQTVDSKTGHGISGAVYHVLNANGDFDARYETDANGEVVTQQLDPGTYYVKQTVAPAGYLLDTVTHTIDVLRDQVNLAKFFNVPMSGILIECVVSGANFGLAGATVTVEDAEAKEVFRGTTTAEGILQTGKLNPGLYLVKVISTPDAYTCVQAQGTVSVSTDNLSKIKFEFVGHNHIIINLTDALDPAKGLSGSKFRIEAVNGDFVTEVTTDAAGHAVSDALPNGQYMVHQIQAPVAYVLDQSYQWATVDSTADTVLDFVNHRYSGLVICSLTERDHSPIPGAVYEIWVQNGPLVTTVTTDATGSVQVPQLNPDVYVIKEVTVPSGYTVRQKTQIVTITADAPITAIFYHTQHASLTVNKSDAASGLPLPGAKFRITDQGGNFVGDYITDDAGKITVTLPAGLYHIAETQAPDGYVLDPTSRSFTVTDEVPVVLDIKNKAVSGVTIINTCAQHRDAIPGSVFKVLTASGTLVGNYTTNVNGEIHLELQPGKYVVYQTYVDKAYVLNTQTYNLDVVAGENLTLEVENTHLSGVNIHVVDKDTSADIYGVEIEIKDARNNYIGRYRTDNYGMIRLSGVLDAGRYTLTMYSVPSDYDKDTVPKTIEVVIGEVTDVVWKIQGHKGQVTIVTYAGEDNVMMNVRKNTILPGAVYQITDATGKTVGTIQGDVNGCAYTGVLALGTYYIQQIVAPSGWQINTGRVAVNVARTNDNIRIEVYNKAANYQTAVTVNGQAQAVAGANLKYYFTLENKSTCNISNMFLHIKVPTDAMRAVTLWTGTYSGTVTTYSIQYKTNMQDYRTLASGLNSQSNYSYGVSSQALNLQAGEYVTDIRLVFNQAVPGFHNSMAATLTTYALVTVPTGYNAIMRAEVGGMANAYYNNASAGGVWGSTTGQTLTPNAGSAANTAVDGGWISASAQFTTFMYGIPQPNLPKQLPKMGY